MKKLVLLIILSIARISIYSQPYQIEWQSCFGGTEKDNAWDIVAIEDGYLVAGATRSNDGDILYNHGTTDGWLIKIDHSGSLIWEKTYGGSWGDGIFRIFPTENHSYYLLCSANSSDGDVSYDPYPETADFWIVKIDSSGSILWEKIVGGNGDEQLWTGTLTDDGGVVAYGWSGSTDGDVSINYGAYDMWMVKLSSEGEKEWDFSIGTDWFDYGQAVIQTSDGGFLCGGSSAIGEGGNLTCEPFNYNAEAILVKLDKDRNIEWQQCYGGSGHDGVWSILELDDGYLFTGLGTSNDGDLTGSGYHGDGDVWVVKIDFYGNIIWQKCFGGTKYEYTPNIFHLSDNNFSIFGMTKSQDGDVTGNHSQSTDYYDIWMIKVSSDGELLSQQCFGGKSSEMMDFGVVKKSDYNFVIAGQTEWGPSYDVQCTPHSLPVEDFWVFEIQDTLTSVLLSPEFTGEVNVYPNPAKEYLIFEIPGFLNKNTKETTIEIKNIYGQEVARKDVLLAKTVFDLRKLQEGIYFYRIDLDGFNSAGKFIIKK